MDTKVRKFTGRQEDFHAWKREFIGYLTIKKYMIYLKATSIGEAAKLMDPNIKTTDWNMVNNEIYSIIIRSIDEENGDWLEAKCADNGY